MPIYPSIGAYTGLSKNQISSLRSYLFSKSSSVFCWSSSAKVFSFPLMFSYSLDGPSWILPARALYSVLIYAILPYILAIYCLTAFFLYLPKMTLPDFDCLSLGTWVWLSFFAFDGREVEDLLLLSSVGFTSNRL